MKAFQGSRLVGVLALVAVAALAVTGGGGAKGKKPKAAPVTGLAGIKHFVVIYQENHSFDNLYGGWEGVNGLQNADAAHTTQIDQNGTPYTCLRQNDVNLAAMAPNCSDPAHGFASAFANKWFTIDPLIPPDATTCPSPVQAFTFPNGLPKGSGRRGGCTRDLVHKFYQEQYQLNGGRQNRYVVGSDAIGT